MTEQVKQLLQELAQYPDYDSLLLPTKLCKELNIKTSPIEPIGIKEFLRIYKKTQFTDYQSFEVRESDGIIREIKPLDETKLIICKPEEVDEIIQKTSAETSQEPSQTTAPPKEASDSTPLESVD